MKLRLLKILPIIILIIVSFSNCRKAYVPTGMDYSEYGWTFFDDGSYETARRWFREATATDSGYVDGFNGLGWSLGFLDSMEAAFDAFSYGLSIGDTTDYFADLLAGRIFTANALGRADSAAVLAQGFLETDSLWVFDYDRQLDYADVFIALATSFFILQDYESSLNMLRHVDRSFTADLSTQAGLSELSLRIETLSQQHL